MHGGVSTPAVFGRDVEIAALEDSVARAARADGHSVVLEGEAGIGKSTLVRVATDIAAEAGVTVRSCGGDPLGSRRPFGPLLAALAVDGAHHPVARPGINDLPQASSPSGSLFSAASAEKRHATAEALAHSLIASAQSSPTLLIVEDVHWMDSSSLLALQVVGRILSGVPLLLLATSRPAADEDADRDIERLTTDAGVRLPLGPLSEQAVEDLVVDITGMACGPTLQGLLAGAHGNPLLATELLRSLVEDELLTEMNSVIEVRDTALPPSFARRVLDTVHDLDHDARGVLRLGAMLGRTFSLTDLAAASGRSAIALAEPVNTALRAGLLGEQGDHLVFRHELVRAVIYDAVPVTVRAGVHRQIAGMLASTGVPAVVVAEHYARGGQPGDTEAITWLQRAAAEVATTAPEAALELLDRACDLAGTASALRSALDVDRVEALGLCGRLAETEALSTHLLHTLRDDEARNKVRQLRAATLLLLNRGGEAGEELLRLAGDLQPAEAVRSLAEAAICFLAAGDTVRAKAAAVSALDRPGGEHSGVGRGLALGILSRDASTRLEFESSLRLAEEGLRAAERDGGSDAHMYQPLFFTGLSLHDLDRLDEVQEHVAAGRLISAEHGWGVSDGPYCALAAFTHLRAGRIDAAAHEARSGVALGERLGSRLAIPWCNALLALASLHRDDVATAQAAVADADAVLAEAPLMLGLDLLVLARALVQEANGQRESAAAELYDTWSMFQQLGLSNLAGAVATEVVRLTVSVDQASRAQEVADFLDAAAEQLGLTSWRAAAAEAQGLMTADAALLLRAVDLYAGTPRMVAHARAMEHAGTTLCAAGERQAGRRLLRESMSTFASCGAVRDQRRVAVALRAAGGRVPTSRIPPGATGWDSLSAKERQVADLVADGLANAEVAARLFVSRRTVETHLYRIYGKLGVRTRVELAVLANRDAD